MDARWLAVIGSVVLTAVGGCARVPAASTRTPHTVAPDLGQATDQARCSVRRSADRPLVVEWPAADRAALEARAQRGLVAVRYEGCSMEVLTHCEVAGQYDFVALSPKQERVSIRSADELYARLPVGAARLEGKLERGGELTVDMSIVGRQQADRHVVAHDELSGRCERATHVLTGLTVGAFTLHAVSALEAGASAKVAGAGAGGSLERGHELLARDGDPRACEGSTGEGTTVPPPGCGALLRVEAVPLAGEPPPASSTTPAVVTAEEREDRERYRRRMDRRSAAWRGVAISSGVLSAASLGGLVGGGVFLVQSNDFAVFEEPSADQLRRKKIGTAMVVSSSIGFVGFGALAIGASAASHRSGPRLSWVAPTIGQHGAGVSLRGRF